MDSIRRKMDDASSVSRRLALAIGLLVSLLVWGAVILAIAFRL